MRSKCRNRPPARRRAKEPLPFPVSPPTLRSGIALAGERAMGRRIRPLTLVRAGTLAAVALVGCGGTAEDGEDSAGSAASSPDSTIDVIDQVYLPSTTEKLAEGSTSEVTWTGLTVGHDGRLNFVIRTIHRLSPAPSRAVVDLDVRTAKYPGREPLEAWVTIATKFHIAFVRADAKNRRTLVRCNAPGNPSFFGERVSVNLATGEVEDRDANTTRTCDFGEDRKAVDAVVVVATPSYHGYYTMKASSR